MGVWTNKRPEKVPSQTVSTIFANMWVIRMSTTPTGLRKVTQCFMSTCRLLQRFGVDEVAEILENHNIENYL